MLQLMIATRLEVRGEIATRLCEVFDFRGFKEGRGRAQRIASAYNVSRETARKWLAGEAVPEISRLVEMTTDTPYSATYVLNGRDHPAQDWPAQETPNPYAASLGGKLVAKLQQAVDGDLLNDADLKALDAVLTALLAKG